MCNIHDELSDRMDAAVLVKALLDDGGTTTIARAP